MIKKINDTDNVNLTKIILHIGDNIWKVAFITLSTVILTLVYYYSTKQSVPSPSYIATTEIEPISNTEILEYERYNLFLNQYALNRSRTISAEEMELRRLGKENLIKEDLQQNTIDKYFLLDLFIDNIRGGEIIINEIKKFNFIKEEDYKDNKLYEDDIKRLVNSIKLLPPDISDKMVSCEKASCSNNWRIQFETKDKIEWLNFLKNIEKYINADIREYISNKYEKFLFSQKEFKQYRLEDLDQRIENSTKEYDNQIDLRLSLLKEQAQISRELQTDKSNLEDTPSLINMSGYKMIKKEIELIENRRNKETFISEINGLKREKKNLISNKNVERLEMFLKETPIFSSNKFTAGKVLHLSSIFRRTELGVTHSLSRVVILSILLGLILGVIYTLIENVFRFRRQN